MIYTYHRCRKRIDDSITVTPIRLFLDFLKLKLKVKRIVFLDEYAPTNPKLAVLRFDDGYKDFLDYTFPLIKLFGYKCELFVVGDWIKNEAFLNKDDLLHLASSGKVRLEWHTKSHKDLTSIEDENILTEELSVDEDLKSLGDEHFKYIAYPYWKYNDHITGLCKKNFRFGVSGGGYWQGDDGFNLDSVRMG